MNDSQLLITFTTTNKLNDTIENIKKTYTILFDRIFVLQNKDDEKELICSYNIDESANIDIENIPSNTIGVHRKKHTNTLYTINALNYLIQVLNDGKLDKNFSIPWENYSNCILVTNGGEYKKINTKLFDIVEIVK
jgi:hypothetical protein